VRFLTGPGHHETVDRAIRLLGFGLSSIVELAADADGMLRPDALARALDADPDVPTVVLLQAGDLNTGRFDEFSRLIPLARRYGAWVHVDGAFGLWARASARLRPLTEGIDAADSWATDGHKWLNVPYDSGYAFVRDRAQLRAAMTYAASYVDRPGDARNPADFNPEWSRRARAFPTYAALSELGRRGIAELVERNSAQAKWLVEQIGALPGGEVVCTPCINQGLVRFRSPDPNASELDHDQRTDAVIFAIREEGTGFFGGVRHQGRRAMRVSVSNHRTTSEDLERVVAAIGRVLSNV
jgi:aromatic-L-amino-acid decarboxylase